MVIGQGRGKPCEVAEDCAEFWAGWVVGQEKHAEPGQPVADVAVMNKDEAVARLQRYWTDGS